MNEIVIQIEEVDDTYEHVPENGTIIYRRRESVISICDIDAQDLK